jgi:hypothetical protein
MANERRGFRRQKLVGLIEDVTGCKKRVMRRDRLGTLIAHFAERHRESRGNF